MLGVRVEDDEGIFDTPVGGVGHMRNAGQAVKGDVVLARVLAEDLLHLAAQIISFFEMLGKAVDRKLGGIDQALDLC